MTITRIPPATTVDYSQQSAALQRGVFADPFSFLGPHKVNDQQCVVRVFLPGAETVVICYQDKKHEMLRYGKSSLFSFVGPSGLRDGEYRLEVQYPLAVEMMDDCYRFSSALDTQALYLFNEGTQQQAYRHLGAHFIKHMDVEGVRFSVWAPNAQSVSVVGDFNHWQPNRHFMRKHPACGVWDLFLPGLVAGQCYKFSIVAGDGTRLEKADPYAVAMQHPPHTASVLARLPDALKPGDSASEQRAKRNAVDAPVSIYEVHAASWRRHSDGSYYSYRELAETLIPYVLDMGFTHIQLMPVSEYPFDGSWGYQPVGLFAPTSRFGSPCDFAYFCRACYQAGLGLILDWVPGHFPSDPHGLARFDGTHLYEHADKRQGFHPDWNTYIYNYERAEVRSFLLSSANYWFDQYAIDGLRVDAVASMLYLDYSRREGEWVANQYGGRENLAAIECLKQVNHSCYGNYPWAMMVAEESTAWPGVTQMTVHGGLGFGYKWNMGWMNDTLKYMQLDPIYRKYHHQEMTFSLVYAYSENYILPLSHDEVVHGKGSLLEKMPGDDWQKFANLRAYLAFMWAHPGKKLLFMGGELAQRREWDHDAELEWPLLAFPSHQGIQGLVRTLNHIYRAAPAMYQRDNSPEGFRWVDGNNTEQSIYSFVRNSADGKEMLLVICNFTPEVYRDFRIGVPKPGFYSLLLNTDQTMFAGSGIDALASGGQQARKVPSHGFGHSLTMTVPPLATLYFKWQAGDEHL